MSASTGPNPSTAESSGRGHPVARDMMPYVEAAAVTVLAFAATALLKREWNAPSFRFFVPSIASAAWRGARGPTAVATGLSPIVVDYFFLSPVGPPRVEGSACALVIFE